jgi:regulation of enolase protein 1 (concanavalin A-like superfamily)
MLKDGFMTACHFSLPFQKLAKILLLISIVLPIPKLAKAALPPGWADADIGSPAIAGSAAYNNGNWTVAGGGSDIWNAADQFNFASTTFNGDGTIIAKVTSLQNTDPGSGWSKAGVMFRNDSSAGSANVTVVATAGNGVSFQWRSAAGGACSASVAAGITAPVWVQLVRSGGTFTGYYSYDGTNWNQVGTAQIVMNGTVLAGLDVTAHNNGALNTATFTNVSLTAQAFGVYRQLWTNLSSSLGNTLTVLTNTTYNTNWPNNPAGAYTHVFTTFETEVNSGMNNYGQRLRGFVVPPVTGNYVFWIASDDASDLFISTDETPQNERLVASVSTWTSWRQFSKEPNQQSAPIYLQAGQRYYLEGLMQQGGGGDNLTVQWQLPDGTVELPLASGSAAGTLLIPFTGETNVPGIFVQPPANTIGFEGGTSTISLLATNPASLSYQWRLNGAIVPGASSGVLVLTNLNLSWNGQVYTCAVSNTLGAITSSPSVLTVLADTNPPTVVRAVNVGLTNVQILYSKPVEAVSATNIANYVFTNGLPITTAVLNPDNQTVILTTALLTYGSNYWLVINNVRDRATTPNTIAANTTISFSALPYVPQDLGNPSVPSVVTAAGNGLNVTAAGSDFGGSSDQGNFSYQTINGNFDIAARVAGLSLSDAFAKAGLMARENLSLNSRFAASFTTPTMNGSFFESRDPGGSAAVSSGNFPANYPNTWLRLRRSANTFTGYGSYDGQVWTQLGSATISMPAQIYLGFAVSSRSGTNVSTAQFRDITNLTSAVVGVVINPHDAIGPTSRRSPIAFSEIMWKPAPRGDTKNLEFVELYNSNPWFHDISGYQITCADMNYTFPPNTKIPGGGYLVVAAVPADIQSVYGVTNVMGPYSGSLKNSETLELLDERGAVLLSLPYSNDYPWPVPTDGTGHSLVLANPTYGEGDPRAWDISDTVGGSPGLMDSFTPSPLRNVVINEFLAHTDPPDYDYIELYNHSTNSVDISGCILTDDPNTNKFVIPPSTFIPARGFVFYSETNMNFRLDATGETIYFFKPDRSRVLDAVHFGAQQNGIATGRSPDGANDFYRLKAKTPGTANAPILASDVAINELMYDPISGKDDDQYVELYNRGTNSINLAGWQLTGGVSFTFPTNVVLATNGFMVVARNLTNLVAKYPNLNATNAVGNFNNKLAHSGEYLALTMPAEHHITNGIGGTVTNIINIVVNDLTYGTGGRWGQWANGGGSSLELIDPKSNNRLAANWADSDETQKSVWTNIEFTGVLDNGANYDPWIDYAQIGLLDVGECLVDNLEVNYNGSNYVANSTFESGTSTWTFQGDHSRSSLENTGYLSGHSLHIRSSDGMWTGVNSCEMALNTNSLAAGQTATLRFKARWLHGWPEPLMRLNGNWLEATGRLPLPNNLGTPGLPNSQQLANAGPAIYNVKHNPPLPAASQAAVVTAQVHDPNGVQNLTLNYRLDPAAAYTSVPMKDDGTGGDAIIGDGIFSATIPGQVANTLVAFYISATDSNAVTTRFPTIRAGNNEPIRECLVLFGDGNPGGSFATLHFWLTQANVNRWASLSDLSNEMTDGTMVTGNRIIYNVRGRFAGSPYHQGFDTPVGNLCQYKWQLNDDDQFLGVTSLNRLHQPGNGPGDDGSLQREQIANSFMRAVGVPWLNRRLVAVYVNGNRRGTLMEDAQTPDNDVVKEHFPNDPDGWLYKMQPWFEFGPAPTGSSIAFNNNAWCALNNFTTTGGVKKAARYRYNFEVRRTPVSANDFTNVYSLVDAACNPGSPSFVANMEDVADMENWMRVFAANHAAGNWDSFGAQNAQNLFGYIGAQGTKYSLLMFDLNIVIGNGSWGPGQNLFAINGSDQGMANIYNNPTFRRMYWRALGELVNGPLNLANSAPLIEAKYNAIAANGLNVENPKSNIEPWLSQAQTSIASQLAGVNASNFSVNPGVTISNNVAYITGNAPVNVAVIWINGRAYPLTWTSLTTWVVAVPLVAGSNQFSVTGVDKNNQFIPGASNNVSVVYGGTNTSPLGRIVINEIMYAPGVAGAEFVELYNTSTNTAFDLSGWEFQGLGYTFPGGSIIGPTNYLVLTANSPAFAAAYGATNPVFDVFGGNLQANGETLTLNMASNSPVAKVKYSNQLPWPTSASAGAGGVSLQLIDPRQDNWRVGNWATAVSGNLANPQWVYVTATGTASSSTIYIYLQSAGDVYIDDIKLVAGSVPDVGPNALANGDFESSLSGPWTVSPNLANSTVSTAIKHSGNASLHLISTSAGSTQSSSIWQTTSPGLNIGAPYTLSFWYLQSTNGGPLTLRLSNSGITSTVNPTPGVIALATATPGAANSVASPLTPFPPLWINELQADNLTGITNRVGQHVPWMEIFNPSASPVSLNGIYLANNYTNVLQWSLPTNSTIGAGQFKVIFADGQTNLSTTNEIHANFLLPSRTGSLALTVVAGNGQPQVLDYVDYENVNLNNSYGAFPDGQSFFRQEFFQGTPGASNNASALPPPSFIAYTTPGAVYSQNFDSLPNPGVTSVNADNPVTINTVTYSLGNPYDFAFPTLATGSGGLGISALAGWYGLGVAGSKFGATDGDQTTGGQISFGLPDSANRALGLLATSSTGGTALGVRFVNATGITLNRMNVQITGQVWRQSNIPKTLQFLYYIDPTGVGGFPSTMTAMIPALNVNIPTVPGDVGGVAVDGTLPQNQTNRSVLNQTITNLPPGAALWLVWQMTDSSGKAQGLAIDNLSFSASAPGAPIQVPLSFQSSGANLILSWPSIAGQQYQLEFKDDLSALTWTPLGSPVTGDGGTLTAINSFGASNQRFFRLRLVN